MEKIFIVYFFIISLITVILTIYDKNAARKRKFRISEATLILCGVFGGAIAELVTMLLIRHKTRHIKFMLGLPLIILAQGLVIAGVIFLGVLYA
ncbi:MAG: DUF1294 domain-containing protein [Clostridia bacterium]|nr:DUF1294 domain-containing protein [Clostridia bacterium]